jgi:hypothetical protein
VVWTPKGGAPATFNLNDAFAALITGDVNWGWLLSWVPLINPVQFDTAQFCARGPMTVPPLGVADFHLDPFEQGLASGTALLQNAARLQAVAMDRVFGAYCEQVTTVSNPCTVVASAPDPPNPGWRFVHTPDGTQYVKMTFGGGGHVQWWFYAHGNSDYTNYEVGNQGNIANIPGGQTVSRTDGPNHQWMAFTFDLGPQPTLVEVCGAAATVVPHVPTAQAQPAGVIAPLPGVYADISSLGKELDRLELKAETILAMLSVLVDRNAAGPVTSDPPADAAAGPLVAPGAIGYAITVAGIPVGSTEMFGTPVKYARIGRYSLGSANGWLPAVEVSHSPMLVAPLPPGVDRIQVTLNAPETGTVKALYPPKLPAAVP